MAESIRELCLAIGEFVTITKQDVLEGLKMARPRDSHQPSSTTLFSWVLGPPTEEQETPPAAIETAGQSEMLRLQGRAHPFLHPAPTQPPTHPQTAPMVPMFPSIRALAVVQPITPPQLNQGTSADVATVERMMLRVSSVSTSRVVWDDSTGSVYLDTIAASIGKMVLGSTEPNEGPTIEDIMDQL